MNLNFNRNYSVLQWRKQKKVRHSDSFDRKPIAGVFGRTDCRNGSCGEKGVVELCCFSQTMRHHCHSYLTQVLNFSYLKLFQIDP